MVFVSLDGAGDLLIADSLRPKVYAHAGGHDAVSEKMELQIHRGHGAWNGGDLEWPGLDGDGNFCQSIGRFTAAGGAKVVVAGSAFLSALGQFARRVLVLEQKQ